MSFRIRPTNLCMADAMPFQQHHEVRIAGRDIRDVLTEELFLDVRANLQVGDEIVICGYADNTWAHLRQFVRVRITSNTKDHVRFLQDGDVREIPLMEDDPVPAPRERTLDVAKEFGGGFNVIDRKSGSVVEKFKTKKEAEEFVAFHDRVAA